AARAGVRAGDRILAINDLSTQNVEAMAAFPNCAIGDQVTLTLRRGDRTKTVVVKPTAGPREGMQARNSVGLTHKPPPAGAARQRGTADPNPAAGTRRPLEGLMRVHDSTRVWPPGGTWWTTTSGISP